MHYRTKKKVGKYVGLLLAAVILSYTAFEMKDVVRGPDLSIQYPQSGATVSAGLVSLRGAAKHVSVISVNGGELFTDLSGHFAKDILLSEGYNVVKVKAQDTFGRTVEKKLELIAKKAQPGIPLAQVPEDNSPPLRRVTGETTTN